MSIETEVAQLTTATDTLTANIEARKAAVLDVIAASGDTYAKNALASAAEAEGYREDTLLLKEQAYEAVRSAGSAASHQDLAALAASKAVTAADVFVYDTSLDSDGGAWRQRCTKTSWYNETLNTATRGARREFPAVAVIVAESNKVTIYDGDDPSLPMWMVFNVGSNNWLRLSVIRTVVAMNGIIAAGAASDLVAMNFIKEHNDFFAANLYTTLGNISQRNDGLGILIYRDGYYDATIVNRAVNDVAITVLPDAPIDPATGLPIPTIAVATDGGVSVIKDNGTVVDLTRLTSSTAGYVNFDEKNRLIFNMGGSVTAVNNYVAPIPDTDLDSNFGDGSVFYRFSTIPYLNPIQSTSAGVPYSNNSIAYYFSNGLSLLNTFDSDKEKGMVAGITSTYNTGWMNGDSKLATLSDTTAETVGLIGSANAITNGDFTSNIDGWTANDTGVITWDSGSLKLERTEAGSTSGINLAYWTATGFTVGVRYEVEADIFFDSADSQPSNAIAAGLGLDGSEKAKSSSLGDLGTDTTERIYFVFEATSTTHTINLGLRASATGFVNFDNIKVARTNDLVSSGTFISGISLNDWAAASNATLLVVDGELEVTNTVSYGYARQTLSTVVGQSYKVQWDARVGTAPQAFLSAVDSYGELYSRQYATSTTKSTFVAFFTARATSTSLYAYANTTTAGQTAYFDNISVHPAILDRSVNGNGLQVYGQITKTPVATGADIVAYSGFSASNYLEQPYNPDLDFGTGDFCVMGWFKGVYDGVLFSRAGTANIQLNQSGGKFRFTVSDGSISTQVNSVESINSGNWNFFVGIKIGETVTVYVNGNYSSQGTASGIGSLSDSSAILTLGNNVIKSNPYNVGSIALWRISATAPTAEQIKKIYEDEKVLFQENAACALYGSSDAVTALAHDPVTDILHVGTSSGRSDFKGLRRINNTTTAVGTAISASNGLIVEE